jgi:hypothetical protein
MSAKLLESRISKDFFFNAKFRHAVLQDTLLYLRN